MKLRVRVGGWEDTDHFLGVGRKIFWDLNRLLKEINRDFDTFDRILDFGCGCARVLRFVKPRIGQSIEGTDIDMESIHWCQDNLFNTLKFHVNSDIPPLAYPDESFDFIFSISVFTHLPEEMQFQWLGELKRILKRGGVFITTFHGEDLFPAAQPEIISLYKEKGFYYLYVGNTLGLPEYYQAAFHTNDYIQKKWCHYFKILHIGKRAINNHQDAVVCEKE
jgi:SAM-dependent methyltransferase